MTTKPLPSKDTLFKKVGYMIGNAVQQLGMEKGGIKDEPPSFDKIDPQDADDTHGYAFNDNTELFLVFHDNRIGIVMPEITLLFINAGNALTQSILASDGKSQIAKNYDPATTQDDLVELLHKGFQPNAFIALASESAGKHNKLVNG